MFKFFFTKPQILFYIVLQLLILSYTGSGATFIVPAVAFLAYFMSYRMIYPFIALLIVLPLADSTLPFSMVAFNMRPTLLILLAFLIGINQQIVHKIDSSIKTFLPYFAVLIYFLFDVSNNAQIFKSLSYILIIMVTPVLINHIIAHELEDFLQSVILIFALVFVASFLNLSTNRALSTYGRFSGIFYNPNALGIFSFLFLMLSNIIFKFHPNLFSKIERIIVTLLIWGGILYSRSRSGIFASLIFFISMFVYDRWKLKGLTIVVISLLTVSVFVTFEDLIRGLGLADFLRLESLETGSGRKLAMTEALNLVKENPIDGYGIGFTEKYYLDKELEFESKGHAGSVHNSFLWVWLDLGIVGLLTFFYGWFSWFKKAFKYTNLILPLGIAIFFSVNVEAWLMGSLNHVTIQLIIILTLMSSPAFLINTIKDK